MTSLRVLLPRLPKHGHGGRGTKLKGVEPSAAWQFASGLTNVVLDWPLLAAVGHTGGAAALVIVLTGALCATRGAGQRDAVSSASSLHLSSPIR